jgi:hypothetical protein
MLSSAAPLLECFPLSADSPLLCFLLSDASPVVCYLFKLPLLRFVIFMLLNVLILLYASHLV